MGEAALSALATFLDPLRLGLLMVGVLAGLAVGILPGLGGIVAVSVLLPLIFRLDAATALATLSGALAVVYTGDVITSVLVGTPGSPAAAPTALEGHALARQGQAARALSAAFLSSLIGGFLGIVGLTLAIPVARPLVMLLGSPELFMFTALGVAYAGSLLGRSPLKGLLSGLLGLLLGLVGPAPAAAEFRYTFGQLYLLDGLSLVVLALGVFGVAEVVSLQARGGAIARQAGLGGGWVEGIRDVFTHRWLVLRGALIGVWAGVLPAIGATAAAWMSYGHAVATTRDRERFGRGDIRGVIAPESANNAAAAGDLIPTLLFSVPGGPAAAVILGALYAYGIYPGPRLVQDHLDLVYVVVWSFALANILGAALSFLMSPAIARITHIPFAWVAAPLLVTMALGAFQSTRHPGDLLALFVLGLLGWAMKRSGWPRAPLLIGFVLAKPMERYLWLTVKLHGWRWLGYPGVLAIGALMAAPAFLALVRWWRRKSSPSTSGEAQHRPAAVSGTGTQRIVPAVMAATAFLIFGVGVTQGFGFQSDARLVPLLAAIPGLLLAVVQFVRTVRGEPLTAADDEGADESGAADPRRELTQFLLVAGYLLSVWLVGFHAASFVFVAAFLWRAGHLRPPAALAYGVAAVAFLQLLGTGFDLRWPAGVLVR
ncbi:MAG: tripartite tricarboxylate transporter permease [Armatimonadota bacterium]|nr:tripartite tricarboxylate transporter permease [Armatimonadota bacterium]MDR7395721.1 tripartite tricarboxylate transporter permease [Armatimonadota bacterium]MDR7399024.1 tripartite tricarboxylate transporter permease [Armatimonadota bacterium]MDR7529765.1 tripartite tricarboxylate transporter permease [Armatimonadota bacterium]MDR7605357.1 tripartite tricarboxylate transporter permease [Armatimonadota bacterium]